MKPEQLKMGKYNLTIQKNSKALSIFSRKNGDIYFCINDNKNENKYTLNSKSAKIIGEKLIELSKSAEILEKCHQAKNQENSYHHIPEINEEAIEELLQSFIERIENKDKS